MSTQPKVYCDDCKVVDLTKYGHHWNCPKAETTWEEKAGRWEAAYKWSTQRTNRNNTAFLRLHESVALWQGKFRTVKHENNELRKQVQRGTVNAMRRPRAPSMSFPWPWAVLTVFFIVMAFHTRAALPIFLALFFLLVVALYVGGILERSQEDARWIRDGCDKETRIYGSV